MPHTADIGPESDKLAVPNAIIVYTKGAANANIAKCGPSKTHIRGYLSTTSSRTKNVCPATPPITP